MTPTQLNGSEELLSERLQFEALLSDLSATFVNLPVAKVGEKIEHGLQRVVEFLGFDRSTLYLFSDKDGRLHQTNNYSRPGINSPPAVLDDILPVWVAIARRGKMFFISDPDELPDDQWREKEYCLLMGGIKSILFIPLSVGGNVLGVVSFVSNRSKRTWPDEFIQRLRLLGELFANVIERKRAEQKIQEAFSEIKQLKDRLEVENLYLRDQLELEHKHEEIIGQSTAIRNVLRQVEQVADTDSTVLLLGETGTGKELLARAIHRLSSRRHRTLVRVNCAALPATLIESELFGREKGAYTGALTKQIGRFEAADGSTIFLDEVGELPLELQSKLLRVLQEGQLERLGSGKTLEVDVRVIAATNRDLAQAVKQGEFREDLYYRLNVFPISIPPLRERSDDIPLLTRALVKELGATLGKSIERIPKKSLDDLQRYPWPGNVRELRNVIERAMILNNGPVLQLDLPNDSAALQAPAMCLAEVERRHVLAVMETTGWRVRGRHGAAEILGLKPTTLDSKMQKLGIRRPAHPSEIP